MWESNLSNITLIDVISTSDVSVRLSNCIQIAMEDDLFPIKTVEDYLHSNEKAIKAMLRIPNMGKKSVRELDALIKTIAEAGGIYKISDKSPAQSYGTHEGEALLRIDEIVVSNPTSERLRNSIRWAVDHGGLPFEVVGDYVNAGDRALRIMQSVPNMGKKTAKELDDLIKEILANSSLTGAGSPDPHEGVALLRIDEIVESNPTSERLRNSIRWAVDHGGLPLEVVGDYVRAGNTALRIMQSVPNLGKKTAVELDELIKDLLANFSESDIGATNALGVETSDSSKQRIEIPEVIERLLVKFHESLSEREYGVLKYRAVENKTLEEVGQTYSITRERVRQIESKAIKKLLRVHREVFNIIARSIDEILDESYGEAALIDAAGALNLTPETLKLLVYICSPLCNKHVRIQNGCVIRTSTGSNHSEWNDAIDELLYSLEWPISVSEVYDRIQDIPQSYVERYLVKNRGAISQENMIVALRKIPQKARIVYVLREAGRPLHSSEIARRYCTMFGEEINEHNARSIVARMEEALIVDRGVYSLYESINLSENKIDEIRRRAYEYIRSEEKYVSSKVLYRELFKNNDSYPEIGNAYIVHGILQDDARFVIRGGLMVGIREHVSFVEFKSLTEEVHEVVASKGPVSVPKIRAALSDRRKVLSVSITAILENSDEIVRLAPGTYDTIINVFGTKYLYEHLVTAIRLALSDHDQGLFELMMNLRSLEILSDIDITKSIVTSVVNKMADVSSKNKIYSISGNNREIEKYNTIVGNIYGQNKSKLDVEQEVEKQLGTELARKYINVDYRMQSNEIDIGGSKGTVTGSGSEIGSILSAFET